VRPDDASAAAQGQAASQATCLPLADCCRRPRAGQVQVQALQPLWPACPPPLPAAEPLPAPLGFAGALAGNPFLVDRQFIAQELGMVGGVCPNSMDAVSDRCGLQASEAYSGRRCSCQPAPQLQALRYTALPRTHGQNSLGPLPAQCWSLPECSAGAGCSAGASREATIDHCRLAPR
jgi:hypothetical protein